MNLPRHFLRRALEAGRTAGANPPLRSALVGQEQGPGQEPGQEPGQGPGLGHLEAEAEGAMGGAVGLRLLQ
jgi:hypothetical protein